MGLGAVALWGVLATLSTLAGKIPPFQLAAMMFTIGTLVGVVYGHLRGSPLADLRSIPWRAWALGVYGLLGFHVCYFYAIQSAPVLEVSLIMYLWPLLIVLFSGLLPVSAGGTGLKWWHVVGALLGFAGVAVILIGSAGKPEFIGSKLGIAAAFLSAFIWSSYSVLARLFTTVPSSAVTGFCAATAVGAGALHVLLETFVWPSSGLAWLAIFAAGLGPVGLAFYIWDEGMKHGDIRLLGVASYSTPLISTVLLASLGLGTASALIWVAAALIAAGALLASWDSYTQP
jgi:drug/metabolite transporter (DMT)-like permease